MNYDEWHSVTRLIRRLNDEDHEGAEQIGVDHAGLATDSYLERLRKGYAESSLKKIRPRISCAFIDKC